MNQQLARCIRAVAALALAGVTAIAAPSYAATSTTQPTTQPEPTTKPDMTPVVAPGTLVKRDVAYVSNACTQQTLDVYAPANARSAPIIMFVHGGEWTKGDKSEVSFKPKFFVEQGMVFISINYRLSGTAKHPAQVNDIATAVRWVKDHASNFGGDPRRIVLMGHSAGCHLVSLVGLDPRPLEAVDLKPADLNAVVCWSGGAYDLVAKVAQAGMYADHIRLNFGENEQIWRDASPMMHVGKAKPMPQFLFVSAEFDKLPSQEASRKMASLIRESDGKAEFVLIQARHTRRSITNSACPATTPDRCWSASYAKCSRIERKKKPR